MLHDWYISPWILILLIIHVNESMLTITIYHTETMSNVQYHTYYEKKPLKALKVSVSVVTLPLLKIVTRDLDGV